MMTTYNIYCAETNSFEYVFSVFNGLNGVHYQLNRSASDHWAFPEEVLLAATDNGAGIKFVGKKLKALNYSEFAELNLFLNLIKHVDKAMMGNHHIIDASTICKI